MPRTVPGSVRRTVSYGVGTVLYGVGTVPYGVAYDPAAVLCQC
jgi:hypothetical protein